MKDTNNSCVIELKQTGVFNCKKEQCELKRVNYILRSEVGYWKKQHERAREREEELKKELALKEGKIKYLSNKLYSRKTEKENPENEKETGKKRKKGQQKGTKIPKKRKYKNIEEKPEVHELDEFERKCKICGKPLIEINNTSDSEVLEIEVKGYKRKIKRKKYKRGCDCKETKKLVTAPAPGKIIPKGKIGISIWALILFEKYKLSIPITRVLKKFKSYNLDIAKGTVGDGLKRISKLFEPIYEKLEERSLLSKWWQADETRWRVFVKTGGKSNYQWYLWVFISEESIVHIIDPTRSAEVIEKHLGIIVAGILLVDRYSAYKSFCNKRERMIIAFCWAHVRRDFIDAAKKYPELTKWSLVWKNRIKKIYAINDLRVQHEEDTEEFKAQNKKLKNALSKMKSLYKKELLEENLHIEKKKVLTSLENHWDGLLVFVDNPHIPMDNNRSERTLRNPVIGRKNYYGSGALWSARFTAVMLSIFETLDLWGINAKKWLDNYLAECAERNGQAPNDVSKYLPWNIDTESFNKLSEGDNSIKQLNKIYCGREFSPADITLIKETIASNPTLKRTPLSKSICKNLGWYKPDGKLKDMSCRVALLRMEEDGLIKLPPSQNTKSNNKLQIEYTEKTDYKKQIIKPAGQLKDLKVKIIKSRNESILWNEYIDRYHYLGYKKLPGAQLRYFIYNENDLISLIGFGASAWRVAPRDSYIGWSDDKRKENLHLVINNARFLILPWVKSKNLASKILSEMSKRIQVDWYAKYNYKPVLVETFVDSTKFSGTCYKAANWKYIGITKGRGKLDYKKEAKLPPKYIFLYPLEKKFRHFLC
jgi:transposase